MYLAQQSTAGGGKKQEPQHKLSLKTTCCCAVHIETLCGAVRVAVFRLHSQPLTSLGLTGGGGGGVPTHKLFLNKLTVRPLHPWVSHLQIHVKEANLSYRLISDCRGVGCGGPMLLKGQSALSWRGVT